MVIKMVMVSKNNDNITLCIVSVAYLAIIFLNLLQPEPRLWP